MFGWAGVDLLFETSTGNEREFSRAIIYSYVSLFKSFGIGTPFAVSWPASRSLVCSSLSSITRVYDSPGFIRLGSLGKMPGFIRFPALLLLACGF